MTADAPAPAPAPDLAALARAALEDEKRGTPGPLRHNTRPAQYDHDRTTLDRDDGVTVMLANEGERELGDWAAAARTREPLLAQGYLDAVADNDRLRAALAKAPLRTFDQTAADALADEVNVLVRRKIIDSRSPAADALLSYRDPPASERGDRLAIVEAERDAAVAALEKCESDKEFIRRVLAKRGDDFADGLLSAAAERDAAMAALAFARRCIGDSGTEYSKTLLARIDALLKGES